MSRLSIAKVLSGKVQVGDTVSVSGWVRTKRDSKAGISFVNVHDGTCFDALQVICESTLENYQAEVLELSTGCSVEIEGIVVESPGAGQTVELKATKVVVVGWVDDPAHYPMQQKRHSMEFLRDNAHLRARTNIGGAMARIRHTLSMAIHSFFASNDFFWVHTPIITANDAEGAGEMFRVSTLDLENLPRNAQGHVDFSKDFFGRETHLTVSGQLAVETYAMALSKVYTFGPTFRAENSNTRRHLAEFWMVEPEIAFADLQDNADLAEAFLKHIFNACLNERADDMAFFEKRVSKGTIARLEQVVEKGFERMEYTEAIDILLKSNESFEFPVEWGIDLSSEHERYIAEKHVGGPVVLMNYPKDIKAFYMRMNEDNRTVAAMDVLVPGIGELIGGSQREERLERLDMRIDEMGLPKENYWWYRDLRRYGTVPHAGFGLGFERAVQYVTGIENIRDAIPFPRTPGHAEF